MASTQAPTADTSSRISPNPHDSDNESEWEYEYSTTETETYYVTMDISKADFVTRSQAHVPSGRGTKERALADIFARKHDDDNPAASKAKNAVAAQKPPQSSFQEDGADDQANLHEFQILDLHSENPLIAYRGRIFEGNWSRNIGTEFLFVQHDEANPLPAVRQLDNGVDLLAASSARISLTEKSSKPVSAQNKRRQPKVRFEELEDFEGDLDEAYPSVPDPEPGASMERYEQGDFLSKLIAVKKRKGETDEVTVIAKLHDEGKKKAGQKKPKVEDPEKQAAASSPAPRRGRGGRARGRGRGIGRGRKTAEGDTSVTESASKTPARKTPHRWSRTNGADGDGGQVESQNEAASDVDPMDVDESEDDDYRD